MVRPLSLFGIDAYLVPFFQLIYDGLTRRRINAVFPTPGGVVLVSEAYILSHPLPEGKAMLKRILKYPSWKYAGEHQQK